MVEAQRDDVLMAATNRTDWSDTLGLKIPKLNR